MNKALVYNSEAKEINQLELNEVFGIKPKSSVVHQVYVALRANNREPWADTKGKGEVRGGGKKPWKQKGTGRARHGSSRSPIWAGGGITFGPLSERNYKQKINKKMGVQAMRMCFADKLNEGKLLILENVPAWEKTKAAAEFFGKLPSTGRNTLLLVKNIEANLLKTTKNLQKLTVKKAVDANVLDLLHHQYVVLSKEALVALEKRLVK